jgi:hypothetical protein
LVWKGRVIRFTNTEMNCSLVHVMQVAIDTTDTIHVSLARHGMETRHCHDSFSNVNMAYYTAHCKALTNDWYCWISTTERNGEVSNSGWSPCSHGDENLQDGCWPKIHS